MPPRNADVEVRWDEGIRYLQPLDEEQASAEEGIALNLAYADVRGTTLEDAREALEEEYLLLTELERVGWETEEAEEVIEANMGAMGLTSWLDPGVAGLVLTLAALGATPISSCNGGFAGTSTHASDVPHVLFSAPPEVVDVVLNSAKQTGVGIVHNRGFAEAFANNLLDLHALAILLIANG
jgi:hypothetical protein